MQTPTAPGSVDPWCSNTTSCALKQLESVEMKGAKQNASAFQVETPLLGRAHHHGNVFLEQIQTFEVCRARFLPRTTRAPPEGREWQLLAAGK